MQPVSTAGRRAILKGHIKAILFTQKLTFYCINRDILQVNILCVNARLIILAKIAPIYWDKKQKKFNFKETIVNFVCICKSSIFFLLLLNIFPIFPPMCPFSPFT